MTSPPTPAHPILWKFVHSEEDALSKREVNNGYIFVAGIVSTALTEYFIPKIIKMNVSKNIPHGPI
jgi:hypothetical protein